MKTEPQEETPTTSEQTKELAELGSREIAPLIDFAADAGAGQDFEASDLGIPFLMILQKNSPQIDEAQPGKYIKDAKAGMLYNSVTNKVYDARNKGVEVVYAGYRKVFVEWIPRDAGGGFVGQHLPEAAAVRACKLNDKGKLMTSEGHQMIETAYHFVVYVAEGEAPQWAVIGMTSTQLKKSRRWNSAVSNKMMTINGKTIKPPVFAFKWLMKTAVEQKDQNTWYGFDISEIGVVDDKNLYEAAKAYFAAVESGAARVTAPPSDSDEPKDERVPF
jgi:hypothetical protein